MRPYWLNRGYVGPGFRFTVEALARTRPDDRSTKRCRVLFDAGQIACFGGRYREALPYLEESLAIAKELGDKYRVAAALQPLSMACTGLGQLEASRRHAQEAVSMLSEGTNAGELAAALTCLGQSLRVCGDLDAAEQAYQQSLSLAGGRSNEEMQAIILLNVAITALLRGRLDTTRAITLEVIAIEERLGSSHGTQSVLEVCAALAAATGDHVRVARYFGAAEAIAAQSGLCRDPTDQAFLAPLIEKSRAALGASAFDAGERLGRALRDSLALEEARAWLSR